MCCGEKAVLVSVYVERPRRELRTNPSRKRHQHHVRGKVINGGRVGGGYDRRAHLLHYSQQLREAARIQSPASTPSNQSPLDSPNNPQHATIVPQVLFHFIYLHHIYESYMISPPPHPRHIFFFFFTLAVRG